MLSWIAFGKSEPLAFESCCRDAQGQDRRHRCFLEPPWPFLMFKVLCFIEVAELILMSRFYRTDMPWLTSLRWYFRADITQLILQAKSAPQILGEHFPRLNERIIYPIARQYFRANLDGYCP